MGLLYLTCAIFFFYYGVASTFSYRSLELRLLPDTSIKSVERSIAKAALSCWGLHDRGKQEPSGSQSGDYIPQLGCITQSFQVLVLTVTCPIIFLVRGVLSLLYGVGFMRTYGPASVDRLAWDSLVRLYRYPYHHYYD